MIEAVTNGLTATKLRIILILTIVLTLGLCTAGFVFFRSQLESYAFQVQADSAAARASTDDIARLQKIQKSLDDNQVAVTRAKSIVADSKFYQYQDQIITDLTSYATTSKLPLTGFSFNNDSAKGAKPAAAGPVASGATPVPAGLKTTNTSVTAFSPARFESVMNFLYAMELNLTKMQLSGVSLTRSERPDGINVSPFIVEVYTR